MFKVGPNVSHGAVTNGAYGCLVILTAWSGNQIQVLLSFEEHRCEDFFFLLKYTDVGSLLFGLGKGRCFIKCRVAKDLLLPALLDGL